MDNADIETEIQSIPSWEAADFRYTTKPFEWLWEYRRDTFIMTQLVDEIKRRAGTLGVNNFMALWKAYLKSRKQTVVGEYYNRTEFDGQPLELLCGSYECRDDCITCVNELSQEEVICTHPIMPVRRLENIDTGEYKTELAYKRGGQWRTRIYDKTTLSSAQSIITLARHDIDISSETARGMVKYLSTLESMNYDLLPKSRCVSRLGWMGTHDFSPYVEDVIFDGSDAYRQLFASVKSVGNYDKWLSAVKRIRRGGNVAARVMLAASFASVLVEPCNALPFFVHVWGGSGAGKTLGLLLAASVWADPSPGAYIGTFNATGVGLELSAGFCNSLPLCVDELQITGARRDFDETIYQLTEGVGRRRGLKSGGLQRIETWRNSIITTGEEPITRTDSGGGAINRIIEIDCADTVLFKNPRELAEVLKTNYGYAGKEFVRQISSEENGGMNKVRETYESFTRLLGAGDGTEKQIMAAALILTADYLAAKYIFHDDDALEASEIDPFMVTRDCVDINVRAHAWLRDFIAANATRFTDNGMSDGYQAECYGDTDYDYIYIISSVFNRIMAEAGFSSKSFLSWGKRNGVVFGDNDGKITRLKRIKGYPTRCVCLKRCYTEDEKTNNCSDLPV